jgi:hypothetical protein
MIIKLRWVNNKDTGDKVLQYSDDNGETWFIVPRIWSESVTSEEVKEVEESL